MFANGSTNETVTFLLSWGTLYIVFLKWKVSLKLFVEFTLVLCTQVPSVKLHYYRNSRCSVKEAMILLFAELSALIFLKIRSSPNLSCWLYVVSTYPKKRRRRSIDIALSCTILYMAFQSKKYSEFVSINFNLSLLLIPLLKLFYARNYRCSAKE